VEQATMWEASLRPITCNLTHCKRVRPCSAHTRRLPPRTPPAFHTSARGRRPASAPWVRIRKRIETPTGFHNLPASNSPPRKESARGESSPASIASPPPPTQAPRRCARTDARVPSGCGWMTFQNCHPSARIRSTMLKHEIESSRQTSGIRGFDRFPVSRSPVTTVEE